MKNNFYIGRVDLFKRLASFGLTLILIANLAFLIWFICVGYVQFFNSDAAVKNLLAMDVFETGSFFPHEWNYGNGDLWVFGGHLFILPWLKFFSNGYGLHAFAGLVTATLILYGTWLLTSIIGLSKQARIIIIAIIASGISRAMAIIIFGEAGYGEVYFIICFLLYFSWLVLNRSNKFQVYFQSVIFLLLVAVCWANPLRGMITYCLPLCVAAAAYMFIDKRYENRRFRLLGIIISGIVVGVILHYLTISQVGNRANINNVCWLSLSAMVDNLGYTLHGFLAMFGRIPEPGTSVLSFRGFYQAGRFVSALSLLFFIPVSCWYFIYNRRPAVRFVTVFIVVSVVTVGFIQITTTVPDMHDPIASFRYLVPALLLSLTVVIAFIYDSERSNLVKSIGLIVCIFMMSGAFTSFGHPVNGSWKCQQTFSGHLAKVLEKKGLKYGYATYWNAGVITVLTGGDVRVRQIELRNGLPVPYRWLSSNRWYESGNWSGATFLVLSDADIRLVDWQLMEQLNGKYKTSFIVEFKSEKVKIFIYNHNIAANFSETRR